MNIVLVGGVNIPTQGGIESYMLNLALHLTKKKHSVWIICRGKEKKEMEWEGVRITQLPCGNNILSLLFLHIFASILILRKGRDIDIVNYQSICIPCLYEWIPKIKGISVCHTQHSYANDNPKYGLIKRSLIYFMYNVSRIIFSPIITVSQYNRELTRKRLGKACTVINCGVNIQNEDIDKNILKEKGIKEKKYYLSISRIDPVKNIDILVKAFLQHPKSEDVQLVICGDTNNSYGELIKSIAKKDERIVFIGPVYGKEKETLLSYCMAFCLISSSEGFPISLLEAMSHSNVCICSSIPACKEILTPQMAIWCKVGDAKELFLKMQKYERSVDSYISYGERARMQVEKNYTWDIISEKYINYIKSLIS